MEACVREFLNLSTLCVYKGTLKSNNMLNLFTVKSIKMHLKSLGSNLTLPYNLVTSTKKYFSVFLVCVNSMSHFSF
jgi:hypothetical protein